MWFDTFYVKVRYHIAELLDMTCQMRLTCNIVQPPQSLAGEARSHPGELVHSAELGEASAGESEVADVLGLVWLGRWRRSEALLREIGPPVEVHQLLRVGLNVIENLAEQLV